MFFHTPCLLKKLERRNWKAFSLGLSCMTQIICQYVDFGMHWPSCQCVYCKHEKLPSFSLLFVGGCFEFMYQLQYYTKQICYWFASWLNGGEIYMPLFISLCIALQIFIFFIFFVLIFWTIFVLNRYQCNPNAPGVASELRITSTRDLNLNVSVSNANMILQAYSSWNNLSRVKESCEVSFSLHSDCCFFDLQIYLLGRVRIYW